LAKLLNVTFGDVVLGDTLNYNAVWEPVSNIASETDYPFSAGERITVSDRILTHRFSVIYTSVYWESTRHKLELYMRQGDSQLFDVNHESIEGTTIYEHQGVAFLLDFTVAYTDGDSYEIDYVFAESYRKILWDCDQKIDLSRGGDARMMSITTAPYYWYPDLDIDRTEGLYSNRWSNVDYAVIFRFPTFVNTKPYQWLAFYCKSEDHTTIDTSNLYAHGGFNPITKLEDYVTESNKWIFCRIPLSRLSDYYRFNVQYLAWLTGATVVTNKRIWFDEICIIE